MLQFIRMKYSRGLLLYHDEPGYGLLPKLIMFVVPASLSALSYYLFSKGERQGGFVLLAEAFIFGVILLSVFPRSYQVFEDHLRIALGGPFSIRIQFDKIKSIEVTNKLIVSVNFATRMTGSYVGIALKKGLSFAITPKDNAAFVESANQALAEWLKTNPGTGR